MKSKKKKENLKLKIFWATVFYVAWAFLTDGLARLLIYYGYGDDLNWRFGYIFGWLGGVFVITYVREKYG